MTEEELNRKAVFLAKDAFKNWLRQQIGEASEKQPVETQAWILALEETTAELRKHLISHPDLNFLVLDPTRFYALKPPDEL